MYAKKSDLSPRHQQDRFLKTAPVTMIRSFLARHRWLAIWLAGAALMLKVLVPAGFMPTVSSGTILVQLCRSEEHTSELQSLMRNSYAVFCLKKKNNKVKHANRLAPLIIKL